MASWIRKKISPAASNRNGTTMASESRLQNRSTALTPSPSSESLAVNPQALSRFFTGLSAEMRIAILTAAFGDRTMHIDLPKKRPCQAKNNSRLSRWRKKNTNQESPPDKITGTVCRRRILFSIGGKKSYDPGVFADSCFLVSTSDPGWPEVFLAMIRVGALGWLQSCRRAYIEGIDILYSTNTFHITSPHLSTRLPSYILPQRLSRIRKVDFAWEWGRLDPQRDEYTFERRLASLLEKLPSELPRLTSLKIALQNSLYPYARLHNSSTDAEWEAYGSWIVQKVLEPLDRLVTAMPTLEVCEVYFTTSVHWNLSKELGERGARFWRGVGDGERGYWVCEGRDDSPRMVCGMGFN
ncbi:hypothetical protein PRZ48_000142 [Zasmidium cellare]|uniref:DUF7730 domain-containing protein n=1 Tax=Zasmidium cellare TaxID=395010 RepID=A0ABR0EXQ7_ZASCE|nr:hypothetical protein PRZ48_000142 [Zasmidium cellare]